MPSYPTVRLVNRHHGMQQDLVNKPHPSVPQAEQVQLVTRWVRQVAAEWRVLFGLSKVVEMTPDQLKATLFGSGGDDDDNNGESSNGGSSSNNNNNSNINSSWFVLFTDGTACGPCRTAKTNLMRLGAAAAGLGGVRVAVVDCTRHRRFCTDEHQAPASPHAPFVKVWPRSRAARRRRPEGQMLCVRFSSVGRSSRGRVAWCDVVWRCLLSHLCCCCCWQ